MSDDPEEVLYRAQTKYKDQEAANMVVYDIERNLRYGGYGPPMSVWFMWITVVALLGVILWRVW